MINKPPPFKGLNIGIHMKIPIKGRGFANQESGLYWCLNGAPFLWKPPCCLCLEKLFRGSLSLSYASSATCNAGELQEGLHSCTPRPSRPKIRLRFLLVFEEAIDLQLACTDCCVHSHSLTSPIHPRVI